LLASGEPSLRLIAKTLSAVAWTTDGRLVPQYVVGLPVLASDDASELGSARSVAFFGSGEDGAPAIAHRRALAGDSVWYDIEFDGRSYRAFVQPQRGEDGAIVGVLGFAFDPSDQAREILALRRSTETLALAQAAAHLAHWVRDGATGETTWSDELYVLFGLRPGSVEPSWSLFASYVHPDDLLALEAAIEVAREAHRPFLIDTRIIAEDKSLHWVQHRGTHVYGGEQPVRSIGTLLDITVRKRAEDELAHKAYYDELTGLPNRKLVADRLRLALVQSRHSGERLAVLSLDLDRFKSINGTLGNETGDRFLRVVAARLKEAVRDSDIVARVGGDEFVLVLFEIPSLAEPARVAERIVATFSKPVAIDERELYSSASVGIAIYPDDADTAQELIRVADTARSRAKFVGPGTFRFYQRAMHEQAIDQLELEHDLHRAYERSEFVLHYQAIVDRQNRPVAVETLLRWEHPVYGTIGPERFIPLCEETGLILPLGRWVIRNAVAQLASWRTGGLPRLRLALNVSSRQIVDPELPATLAAAVDAAGCDPSDLELEITESAAMADVPSARRFIRYLKALGMRVALDDFGTGYSSLSHLKHFDVDGLKIDRTFIRDLPHDRGDAAIVSAIVTLGRELELNIVAEGVETAEQAAVARRLGCEHLQGYYFSIPLAAAAFETKLQAWGEPSVP
jgi:diguanylate cyclase (GGDEF)-like protein